MKRRTKYYYEVLKKYRIDGNSITLKKEPITRSDLISKIRLVYKPDMSVSEVRSALMTAFSQYSMEIKNVSDEFINECLKRFMYESKK